MSFDIGLDRKQLSDRRVGHAALDAVDDPTVAGARRRGLAARLVRPRPMIVDTERRIGLGLVHRPRQVIAVVREEFRQQALTLLGRHPRKQHAGQSRRLRQHRGDVHVADRQLLGDDA
jgi:hypothetical protein